MKIVTKFEEQPTHVLVVLTKNILDGKSGDMLYEAHKNLSVNRQAKDIIFVYKKKGEEDEEKGKKDEEKGKKDKEKGDSCWTFGNDAMKRLEEKALIEGADTSNKCIHSVVLASVQGHEALIYRSLEHEQVALAEEIFQRMKTTDSEGGRRKSLFVSV